MPSILNKPGATHLCFRPLWRSLCKRVKARIGAFCLCPHLCLPSCPSPEKLKTGRACPQGRRAGRLEAATKWVAAQPSSDLPLPLPLPFSSPGPRIGLPALYGQPKSSCTRPQPSSLSLKSPLPCRVFKASSLLVGSSHSTSHAQPRAGHARPRTATRAAARAFFAESLDLPLSFAWLHAPARMVRHVPRPFPWTPLSLLDPGSRDTHTHRQRHREAQRGTVRHRDTQAHRHKRLEPQVQAFPSLAGLRLPALSPRDCPTLTRQRSKAGIAPSRSSSTSRSLSERRRSQRISQASCQVSAGEPSRLRRLQLSAVHVQPQRRHGSWLRKAGRVLKLYRRLLTTSSLRPPLQSSSSALAALPARRMQFR